MTFLKMAIDAANKVAPLVDVRRTADPEPFKLAKEVVYETLLDPSFGMLVREQTALHKRHHQNILDLISDERKYRAFIKLELLLLSKAGLAETAVGAFIPSADPLFPSTSEIPFPSAALTDWVTHHDVP